MLFAFCIGTCKLFREFTPAIGKNIERCMHTVSKTRRLISYVITNQVLLLAIASAYSDSSSGKPAPIFDTCQEVQTKSENDKSTMEGPNLNSVAEQARKEYGLVGVAIGYARLDELPRIGVAGQRVHDSSNLIEPSDRFHLGSVSKSMTATAIASLVEKRQLSWNARLKDLLPEIEMKEGFRDATLEQLLQHRAGVVAHLQLTDQEYARLAGLKGNSTQQRAIYVAEVLSMEPRDNKFRYSNAGYTIAAYIAEKRSGRSWRQLILDEVFVPLKMNDSGFGWPKDHSPNQPQGHRTDDDSKLVPGSSFEPGAFMAPAGNIHCSIGDLLKYGKAHLSGLANRNGGLNPSTAKKLHQPSDGVPYAFGWGIHPTNGQHRHRGTLGTFYAYLVIIPQSEIVIGFACNSSSKKVMEASEFVVDEILKQLGL